MPKVFAPSDRRVRLLAMLVIVQNDPQVPLGAYADMLREEGTGFSLFRPFAGEELPPAAEVSAAIILGGAMGVHDCGLHPFLVRVKRFISELVAGEIPLLGICLGGQLLADALGAEVIAGSPCGEKGTLPVSLTEEGACDPLFSGIPREFVTFQWHQDSFAIPGQGVLLASSIVCPNQAFRYEKCAYGIQFHPEVTREIVEEWALWRPETAQHLSCFLVDFDSHHSVYAAASRKLLKNFLRIASLHPGCLKNALIAPVSA
ncbi:type 1 glutamine amidotransferase [Geobacter sp. DSM 9736]|uniref:type 1 glutamine amidotransferase n=1 Tax=Geobacter sp. DSM 9736 TaxID=1277350 RepID=UPI001E59DBE6|nr:type 1 glutamine amidotransferase [Geobacter sp. DSM 9736]